MKVLHCCYQTPDKIENFITLPNYINHAIEALGHELITFDDRMFILPDRILNALPVMYDLEIKRLNHKLYKYAKKHRPDVCIITGGHRTLPSAVKKIQSLGVKTVLWTTDPPCEFAMIIQLARVCDHVLCAGSEAIEILKINNVTNARLLPFACDMQFHKKVTLNADEQGHYAHDIVFVGSWYPIREKILEQLHDYDLAIWGPLWYRVKQNSHLKKCIKGGALGPDEWIKIYSAAKIIIVIHFQEENVPCYQASPKIFEGLACQGFVLTNDQPDVVSMFNNGQHLVIFNDEADLIRKIVYYLDRADERSAIAAQGYEEIIRNHTYVHRIQEMLNISK
jgi:spore maturation protein CgeB